MPDRIDRAIGNNTMRCEETIGCALLFCGFFCFFCRPVNRIRKINDFQNIYIFLLNLPGSTFFFPSFFLQHTPHTMPSDEAGHTVDDLRTRNVTVVRTIQITTTIIYLKNALVLCGVLIKKSKMENRRKKPTTAHKPVRTVAVFDFRFPDDRLLRDRRQQRAGVYCCYEV